MIWIVFPPLLLGVALIQSAGLPPLPVVGVRPDLMLLFALGWGMLRGVRAGVVGALIGGLLLDLVGSTPLGCNALALAPVALLAIASQARLLEDDLLLSLSLALVGTLVFYGLFLFLRGFLGYEVQWWASLEHVALPAALINALSMPLVYWFLHWLEGRIGLPRPGEGA